MNSSGTTSGRSEQQAWGSLFTDRSGATFRAHTTPDVTFAGSVLLRPITGAHEVWAALQTSAAIYDRLEFTKSATRDRRTYLEWEASALGLAMAGVTVLTTGDGGLFEFVAIHHRPLPAALAFSVEMRRRLVATMDPSFFYRSASENY